MYQYSYGEIMADSPVDARMQEREVFDHAIALLRQAAAGGPGCPAEQEALAYTTLLWSVLIKDLSHPQNDLPGDLRAKLMSVGLWVMAEAQRIQSGESRAFEAIADVCTTIKDGLT